MNKLQRFAPGLIIAACVALSWPAVSAFVKVVAALARLLLPGMVVQMRGAINVGLAQMRDKFAREALADAVAAGCSGPDLAALMVAASRARMAHAVAVRELLLTRRLAERTLGTPMECST